MCVQCWRCSLTWLLIGLGGVWPWKQHQILIVNPQARVCVKHLVWSVTSQFLRLHFTGGIRPQCIHFHLRCNSLAQSAWTPLAITDMFVFSIIWNNLLEEQKHDHADLLFLFRMLYFMIGCMIWCDSAAIILHHWCIHFSHMSQRQIQDKHEKENLRILEIGKSRLKETRRSDNMSAHLPPHLLELFCFKPVRKWKPNRP